MTIFTTFPRPDLAPTLCAFFVQRWTNVAPPCRLIGKEARRAVGVAVNPAATAGEAAVARGYVVASPVHECCGVRCQ